jgi:hypothetical protein
MWECWETFWHDWVTHIVRGQPFAVVMNGDVIEGVHHGAVSQWTQNVSLQAECATAILAPIVERVGPEHFFLVRGTEAHAGSSASAEESMGRELGLPKRLEGQRSLWELKLKLGEYVVHFMHHIGTSGSTSYESTAPMAEYASAMTEAARWRARPPDALVRSHRHRSIKITIPAEVGDDSRRADAFVVITPGWQGKTPLAWRIAGARQSKPQIGGVAIIAGDEELYSRHKVWTADVRSGIDELMEP